MNRYYDLVIVNAMAETVRKDMEEEFASLVPCIVPPDLNDDSLRWNYVKKHLSGTRFGVITEWGLIDFDPDEQSHLVGGDSITYDEYLDLQKQSAFDWRDCFQTCYYDLCVVIFQGEIERYNKRKNSVCFKRISITGFYSDGEGYWGKEDHVWINQDGFENFSPGDKVRFCAEVYRYIKKSKGKRIEFGLRNAYDIHYSNEYEQPSDEYMREQSIDSIICHDLCMYYDHCYNGICIANQEWREDMRKFLREDPETVEKNYRKLSIVTHQKEYDDFLNALTNDAYLGVFLLESKMIPDDILREMNIPKSFNLFVMIMESDAKNNLLPGDIILSIEGNIIHSSEDIHDILKDKIPGQVIDVMVLRDDMQLPLSVPLITREDMAYLSLERMLMQRNEEQ